SLIELLHGQRPRLPDLAQHSPSADVHTQADFYYERDGRPGVCVFVDGPAHDQSQQAARDRAVREELEEQGFRVIAIRYDRAMDEQVDGYPQVFGEAKLTTH